MIRYQRILVSNVEIPSKNVGSWVNRIGFFIERDPNFFDKVLSPSKISDEKYVFCLKRKWIFYHPKLYNFQLIRWIAKDYIKTIKKVLNNSSDPLKIIVMDDLVLCEAISYLKKDFQDRIQLIYSFHGHFLSLPEKFGYNVDKILFLTNLGYQESLMNNKIFSPEVHVIGNGVRSNVFFPLPHQEKINLRVHLGFKPDDEIIVWMANARPAKGLHIFKKVAEKLNAKYPKFKFLIIGTEIKPQFLSPNFVQLGKLHHNLLPKYLQISDYYFFTSLWKEGFGLSLVEAIKCGLCVITSVNGGISEVVENCDNVFIVRQPNMVSAWIDSFESCRVRKIDQVNFSKLDSFHTYESWESKFIEAIES
jgi:glycosyltransferase involved in cell wall biosynthesis